MGEMGQLAGPVALVQNVIDAWGWIASHLPPKEMIVNAVMILVVAVLIVIGAGGGDRSGKL